MGNYVMNADGSDVTYLINDGQVSTWSLDGEKIAFVSYRDASPTSGLGGNIYVMNADGTNVTRLTNLGWQPEQGPTAPWSLAWSPDGQRIAFDAKHLSSEGGQEIYVVNVDGGGLTRLTNSLMDDHSPAWSPDSQRIAFVSFRDADFEKRDYNSEIYIMNADGSGPVRLTYNLTVDTTRPGADEDPTWSPDGRQIAFRSYRDGDPHIYVMNVDGSSATRLTFEGANYAPDWSRSTITSTPIPGEIPAPVPTGTGTPATSKRADRLPTATPKPTRPQPPTPTPAPPANCPDPRSMITSPVNGATIRGIVPFMGTAYLDNLQYYKFEYRPLGAPDWQFLTQFDYTWVEDDKLMDWHTYTVAPSTYDVRLIVVDMSGNYPPPCEIRVTVAR